MTLIAYRNVSDVDIKFEDGTIVEHKYYQNFKEGTILYPIENRIGYERIANNGLKMKIIAYRNSTDLDVELEDGCIVTNKSFSDIKKSSDFPLILLNLMLKLFPSREMLFCNILHPFSVLLSAFMLVTR